MGVWERSPAGCARAGHARAGGLVPRRRCPTSPTTTSSARRTASAATRSTTASAGAPGWPSHAPRWRHAACKLLVDFVPNHVAPDHPWLVEHPDRFVQGTADDLAADPAAFLAVGDGDRRPRPRPVLPAVARRRPARTRSPRRCAPAAIDTLVDIAGAGRRGALRHGDADGQRGVRPHVGRRAPATPPATEYWSDVIGALARRPPRLPVRRRGLLGHGVGPPAARLRPLLRQAALRPHAARRRRGGAWSPARRPRLPARPAPLHREPRRAACRRGDGPRPGDRRGR